jgi:thioredoxin reductase (NADPH)
MDDSYDVLVVGGGAAGLSGALTLARARRRVLVVDAGTPRNAPARGVHNYLGREGTPPSELLAIGRAEVASYGGQVVHGTVRTVRREQDGGFRAELGDGRQVQARRLLLTSGLVDELPDVPGLAERFGRDVLHCPYCHGYEVRDQALGVLSTGPMSVHQALLFRQWTDDVTLLVHTGPVPDAVELERLTARGIDVVQGEVAQVETVDDRLSGVRLRDGRTVPLQALALAPFFRGRSDLLDDLGLQTVPMLRGDDVLASHVAAEPTGATAVPGVYVAGNVANPMAQVIVSAAAGTTAAGLINAELVEEETDAAVAAARAAAA